MGCTWLEFGIIVDRNSAVKEVTYDYSTYRTTEYTYKIIGVRFLNVATSEFKDVYSKDLSGIELNQKEIHDISDVVDDLIGGRFRVRELYANADDIELNYYVNMRTRIYSRESVHSALPVYDKSGNLLVCCNTDLCAYKFVSFLEIVIDAKTLSFDVTFREVTELNRKFRVPLLRGLTSPSWDNALNIMKTDIKGVYLYNGLCFVYGYKEDSLILPDESRKLYISFPESLKTIVFNKDIESVEDYSAFKMIFVKALYIPRDAKVEFMCSLIILLIGNYLLERDQEAVTDIRQLYTTITSLNSTKEYNRIWGILNSSENKGIMQQALGKLDIKVY